MHHLVAAGKGAFVLASGVVTAVASGGIHDQVTVGQLLTGGGGVLLGLAILKGVAEIGRLRQMVYDHDGRITRLEKHDDAQR